MSDQSLENKVSSSQIKGIDKFKQAKSLIEDEKLMYFHAFVEAMKQGGAIDEHGNPSYKALDKEGVAEKVGEMYDKIILDSLKKQAGVKDLSETNLALFYQSKTNSQLGAKKQILLQQGSAYKIDDHINEIEQNSRRQLANIAGYHFKDATQQDVENYFGKKLNEIPTQQERSQLIATKAIQDRSDELTAALSRQYEKKKPDNYKQAA